MTATAMAADLSAAQIQQQIEKLLREVLDVEAPLSASTNLLSDLQLDSLQQWTLVVELENHFRICFEPEDQQSISTVQSIAELVQRRLTAPANEETEVS